MYTEGTSTDALAGFDDDDERSRADVVSRCSFIDASGIG
jgi:hypothetical protein